MKQKVIAVSAIIGVLMLGSWYLTSMRHAPSDQTASVVPSVEEITKVRIANLPVVQGLPLYVAIEKGYFRDAGIEVEVVKFEAPNQIIDALLTGQVDLTSPSGALGISGIANHKNPGKLQVYAIAGGTQGNSGSSFVVPTDSTLTSIGDLKGKKLGILAGTIQWRTITRELLVEHGLDMDHDLTIVELAPSVQVQALASGQVDALLALEPIPTIAVSGGVAKVWIPDPTVEYLFDPSWLGAGIISTQFAETNPRKTKKIIDILRMAADEVSKDPDQYRRYLKGYTALTDELIAQVPITSTKVCGDITVEDRAAIQIFFDIFTKHRVVDGKISVDEVLYCK